MRYTNASRFKATLAISASLVLCGVSSSVSSAQSPEERLLAVLASSVSVADKCNACRQLQTAGSEKSVPALAALLSEPQISHTARMALEVMPYPQAGDALREAAGKTSGLALSGILDSLGERRDVPSVPILADALTDQDERVRGAAAAALAKIGTADAASALAAAYSAAQPDQQSLIGQAWVRCADRLCVGGALDQAMEIYARLSGPTVPPAVRIGALRGQLGTARPGQTEAIGQALAGTDPLIRQAAAAQLPLLPAEAFRKLAASSSNLPSDSRVAMLAAMRLRQDKSLASIALQAADDVDPAIQAAAVQTLGIIGDASALPRLAVAAAADDASGNAARRSLERICAPEVDDAIATLLRQERNPATRAMWISIVEARRPSGAIALLLVEAGGNQAQARTRAMAALANLAGPKDAPALASAVLHAEKGAERDEAEKAVMLVCLQVPNPEDRAVPIIKLLEKSPPADRVALLPLLGRIGGTAAKTEIEAALRSDTPDLYDSGLRAICNWPDASVANQLLALSENAKTPAQRLAALRAFIRVIALPGEAPDDEKLAMLKQAMERAERDDERNLVLQRVSAIRTVEALRFLLPYLDRPPLAQTAGTSIAELARHTELRDSHKQEFTRALEKVLDTNQDAGVLERVRRYLQAP